jgi:hypothetical protein
MSGFSDPRSFYGIHSFTPYHRSTGLPYGELRVLEESSLTMQGALTDLMGGSSKYPWATEDGEITSEISLKGSQYEDFMFELFLGTAPTANTAESTGSVSTLTNTNGTSVMNGTNGIAAAGVTVTSADSGDLKFGRYVIKATGSGAFDLYIKSDIDLGRGNNGTIQSDLLKLTASPLDISSVAAVVAELGLTFTKTGTPAFTVGDTAEFSVRPVNSKSMDVRIGSPVNTVFPEFGAIVMAQKRGNQELMEIDLFRCKAAGMPLGFARNAWSKYEIKIKVLYDSVKDGIFDLRHVTPTNS